MDIHIQCGGGMFRLAHCMQQLIIKAVQVSMVSLVCVCDVAYKHRLKFFESAPDEYFHELHSCSDTPKIASPASSYWCSCTSDSDGQRRQCSATP